MPLFPAFIDLSNKRVLVVGGGKVATRKVKSLLKFTRNIRIVAPKIQKELTEIAEREGLELVKRYFRASDLKGVDLVIVAVDNISLQRRIFRICQRRKILCNSVDSPELCNFIFPSLIVRGDISIGISTSGRAPALSKKLRELIEDCLPLDLEEVLEIVSREREKLPKGEKRQAYMKKLVNRLFDGKS